MTEHGVLPFNIGTVMNQKQNITSWGEGGLRAKNPRAVLEGHQKIQKDTFSANIDTLVNHWHGRVGTIYFA